MPETIGISPKVYVPALAQLAAGVVLLIAGLDVEGKTLIASGIGTLGVGYTAKPGHVAELTTDPPADEGDAGTAEVK